MSFSALFNQKVFDQKAAETLHNLTMSGDTEAAGVRATNAAPDGTKNPEESDSKAAKNKKMQDLLNWVRINNIQIEDFQKWMRERALKLEQDIADNLKKIGETTANMMKNGEFIGKAEKLLRDFKDGKPVDKKEALNLLQERGLKVNEDLPLAVLMQNYIRPEIAKANEENETSESDIHSFEVLNEKAKTEIGILTEQAQKIRETKQELKRQGFSDEEIEERVWQGVSEDVILEYRNQYNEPDKTANTMRIEQKVDGAETASLSLNDDSFSIDEPPTNTNKPQVSAPGIG